MRREKWSEKSWQPGEVVTHIHQIWDYAEASIRRVRKELRRISLVYCLHHQQPSNPYDMEICLLLRSIKNNHDVLSRAAAGDTESLDPDLVLWIDKVSQARKQLLLVYRQVKDDIVETLTKYCSDYKALGVTDDKLFTVFRSKMSSISRTLSSASDLIHYMSFSTVPVHLAGIPSELAQCECGDGHTVTKLVSLTVDLLQDAMDLSHQWVISDRLYLDELKDILQKSVIQFSDVRRKLKIANAEHNTARMILKENQAVLESIESELKTFNLRKTSSAEKKLRQTKLEIAGLEKAVEHAEREFEELDVPDCFSEETIYDEVGDKAYFQQKLAIKRQEEKHLSEYLKDFQNLKHEVGETKRKVEDSISRWKKTKRRKKKLAELKDSCNDKIIVLDGLYHKRLRPTARSAAHTTHPNIEDTFLDAKHSEQ